ncbi:ParB/RepB/Spo0J family partition protein (plasmid) [Nocardia sp. NBC_01503]|uniref:ParB/RepB/Spo0J family partition protein n=1 Tax=Nocardia sp. NBC_01503 TaxID=2975997 RepID=UPI002E7BFC56|nr:ParB/RepB/Spo0J family partition protein [Nocardia sp. NBC_01503]WTL36700.1 ParB/RepB/Spo0J family partition protein [Nocardia sp. NBC_01503]WTL36747.1 ParB/RepB/Spo0J family partition protein [Nocardia sp. NBC_01503]
MATKTKMNLADLVGATGANSVVDGENVVEESAATTLAIPVAKIARNPYNPRKFNPDVSDLASIVNKQLQPGRGITRGAFLKLYPEDADRIGDAEHIAVIGNRRHLACEEFGRETMDLIIDDTMAESRGSLRAWALLENIDRRDLDVIDEALALREQVKDCGGQEAAAKSLGKKQPWISQRLSLLKLPEQIQESVRRGEFALREARSLSKVPRAEQVARWKEALAKQEQDGKNNAKPKPPRREFGVAEIAKAFKKWDAKPDVLATALVTGLEPGEIRDLMDSLQQQLAAAEA